VIALHLTFGEDDNDDVGGFGLPLPLPLELEVDGIGRIVCCSCWCGWGGEERTTVLPTAAIKTQFFVLLGTRLRSLLVGMGKAPVSCFAFW